MSRPRPKMNDEAVIGEAVRKELWPQVHRWLTSSDWKGDEEEIEDSIKELIKAMRYADDGYQAAKNLDDWNPDVELVEILDAFSAYDVWQQHVAVWVAETKPVQPFKAGDKVQYRNGWEPWTTGTINTTDHKHATYNIALPQKERSLKSGRGIMTSEVIVPWEDVRAVPSTGAEPSPEPLA